MEGFVAGDVVAVRFPYSDFRSTKRRPALVLAAVEFNNLILCQITSRSYTSHSSIRLGASNFSEGYLPVTSYARPDKLLTAAPSIVLGHIGRLNSSTLRRVLTRVRALFR